MKLTESDPAPPNSPLDVGPFEPVVVELTPAPDVVSAFSAFCDQPAVLLLESTLPHPRLGRYSFLTADPAVLEIRPRVGYGANPFAGLHAHLERFAARSVEDLPPFQGGAAGLLSYELGQAWEQIPRARFDEFQMPDMAVGIFDWVIAWDHSTNRAWIISHGFPHTKRGARTDRAARRLAEVKARLESGIGTAAIGRNSRCAGPLLPAEQLAPQFPAPNLEGLTSNIPRDAYLQKVERACEYIRAGDIFQVNLSQRLLYPLLQPPGELYVRLRRCNPAPFSGYFGVDDWAVVSSSPERFLRVWGDEIETRPIKGTRGRDVVPEADLFSRDELRNSSKDLAENVMIVDLLRNDLSRVCKPGSVSVRSLCGVETYATVQHLVSEIRARLADGRDAWDLLEAAFPGGSITGAPKVRAMEIIAELEPTARGAYCGSLFYSGFDGQTDSSILIRTMTCRRGWVQCPVGGGIVAASDPVGEYEETIHKAEGMLRALGKPTSRSGS